MEIKQIAEIVNYTASVGSTIISETDRMGKYDSIQAIQQIEEYNAIMDVYTENVRTYGDEKYPLNKQGDAYAGYVSRNYDGQTRILAELVSENYPAAFYESVTDCPVNISEMKGIETSSRYIITLSDTTAQVFIYDSDKETVNQLLLAAVPKVYCFSEDENELIVAAQNKVYVYDLPGETRPRLLTYNFENVRSVAAFENKIYAITENNHIVVWDNPLLERKIHRQNVESGRIMQLDDGQIMAVYVDNGCLVKNINNSEEIYPFPFEGTVDQKNISVSSNCAYAAVSYRPDETGSDWIGLIDLANGTLKQTYDTGYAIVGYTFSEDDNFLLITCYNKYKIARINLETGEIQESTGNTLFKPYTIITYKNKILVCDISGFLAIFNDNLELEGDYRAIGYQVPQKQLAVSPKHDSLLTAGRGGNTLSGSCQTWLSNNNQVIFVPVSDEPMISTTSLAVTDGGDYVAYGNAGGSIYIWDIAIMDQVWNGHCIPESVVHLLFSRDSANLYALGSSGTIYTVDLHNVLSECVPGKPESIFQMQMDRAKKIRQDMYALGLFFNK